MDSALWKVSKFRDFLEARKELLADEVNLRMGELLHGNTRWLSGPSSSPAPTTVVVGGISSQEEDQQLEALNEWMEVRGLPRGQIAYDFADSATGKQNAIFDLAWPNGIQEELSQPVAVLLNEGAETIGIANQAGFRCFTSVDKFKSYVQTEVLAEDPEV